jgi:hypothetical protein
MIAIAESRMGDALSPNITTPRIAAPTIPIPVQAA